ncbi:MAG TPA: hypothetical protein VFS20_16730, partial [Longimicrobium sp.]|nr:hypothetical protein [Longimicrobium sp.]
GYNGTQSACADFIRQEPGAARHHRGHAEAGSPRGRTSCGRCSGFIPNYQASFWFRTGQMSHPESAESSENPKQFLLTLMTQREISTHSDPEPGSAIWFQPLFDLDRTTNSGGARSPRPSVFLHLTP